MRVEPSLPFGDAPCPRCGCLLWFALVAPDERLFFEHDLADDVRERTLEVLAVRLGVSKDELEADPSVVTKKGLDSLDLVELVMDVEDELNRGQ